MNWYEKYYIAFKWYVQIMCIWTFSFYVWFSDFYIFSTSFFNFSTTDEGNYCPWQAICDESTGYNYYWNIETDQVTWECPTEYIVYLKSMQSNDGDEFTQSNQSSENHKKTKKKKDSSQPREGYVCLLFYLFHQSAERIYKYSSVWMYKCINNLCSV